MDPDQIQEEAAATQVLVAAIRERDRANVMLKRLWPMVQELRETLQPLEEEYSKWATKHWSMERRIAEIKKQILKPHSGSRQERTPKKRERTMTDQEATTFLANQSLDERKRLLAELQALTDD